MTNDRNLRPALDHLGWIGPDLAAAAECWRRLGFTLSRVSPQMGFTGPDGGLELWASANRCAVFRDGYLELIGIVAPERFNPWQAYLARGAGPHIAAFRVDEADLAFPPLAERVDGFDPPVQRRRMAPLGLTEADGEMEMGFRNIFSQDAHWPEGRFIVIEHQTPEALWQDALTTHPNGALALVEAVFTAPDPSPTAERLEALLNRPPAAGGVAVMTPDAFAARFRGAAAPDRPAVAAAVVRVEDLATLKALLLRNGVDHADGADGAVVVQGAAAAGGVIAFVE